MLNPETTQARIPLHEAAWRAERAKTFRLAAAIVKAISDLDGDATRSTIIHAYPVFTHED